MADPRPDPPLSRTPGLPAGVRWPSLQQWHVAWGIAVATYGIAMFQRTMPASLATPLVDAFGLSWTGYAAFSSVYLVAYLVLQIPAGLLVDRAGPRRILQASLALTTAAALLSWLADRYGILLFARALAALGDAVVYSVVIKLTASNSSKKAFPFVMSWVQVTGYLGVVCSTAPLERLVSAAGWRAPFLVLATVLACLLAAWTFSPSKQPAGSVPKPVQADGVQSTRLSTRLRTLAPTLVSFTAFYALYIFVFSAWGAVYLANGFALSAQQSAEFLLVGTMGLPIGGVLSGLALTRVENPVVPVMAGVAAALGCAVWLARMDTPAGTPELYACLALMGISFGAMSNGMTATVRANNGVANLSFVSSLHAVVANLATAALMPLFAPGLLVDAASARDVLVATAITLLLLALSCCLFRPRDPGTHR
jgi:predicted MFS family arabinose efflux permease